MPTDLLSTTFAALADPTRRAILGRLAQGEATVNDLAKPFKISLPAVSKHLKVLERAGLIVRSRAAQWRPCRLEAGPLKSAADWIEHYRRFWDASFDRLDDYPDLRVTLESLYEHDLDRTATASALKIHRRTLTYRLARIAELIGLIPTSARGIQILSTALAAYRMRGGVEIETTHKIFKAVS